MTDIHILYENAEWLPPFCAAFGALGLYAVEHIWTKECWVLELPQLMASIKTPLVASSLTRGHAYAPA